MIIIEKEKPEASLTYKPFENLAELLKQPKDKKEDKNNGHK